MALIGPRGSGKTTIAALLSGRTGMPVISTDGEAEKRMGMSIDEIVRSKGWPAFREAEKRVLKKIVKEHPIDLILDCGGGIVLAHENRERLAAFDHIVYLRAEPEALVRRLGLDPRQRPPLTSEDEPLREMRHVLARRDPVYRAMSHLVVDTTAAGPWEIAEQIIAALGTRTPKGKE
jgi:shikimate kinase